MNKNKGPNFGINHPPYSGGMLLSFVSLSPCRVLTSTVAIYFMHAQTVDTRSPRSERLATRLVYMFTDVPDMHIVC